MMDGFEEKIPTRVEVPQLSIMQMIEKGLKKVLTLAESEEIIQELIHEKLDGDAAVNYVYGALLTHLPPIDIGAFLEATGILEEHESIG